MSEPPPNFRLGVFAGVVGDYVRYRLPYPQVMLDHLLAGAGVGRGGRLLDLGCGAGRLTLALAPRFAGVEAVDLEPEMVAAGRQEARRLGVGNIAWSVGRAEDFQAPAGAFDLVTAGEAFHRLERARVAGLALAWLKPGGALATLGSASFMDGDAPWRRRQAQVVRDFIGEPARRLDAANAPLAQEIADEIALLRAAGFENVADFEFRIPHDWDLESLLGNLRSSSVLSRAALGDRHGAFEAELTRTLLAFDPGGRYAETVRFGYTIAHKPA